MNCRTGDPWLGFLRTGGRAMLTGGELRGGVCIMGQSASEMVVVAAFAAVEAGFRTFIIDLDGYAAERISGYVASYSPSYFLYDTMKMDEENPSFHAQLVASAYATALDLTLDQESVLGAACAQIALEQGVASPLAIAERMQDEELRGHASKRLRDRLNGLSSMSTVGDERVVSAMAGESAILDLRESMTPEAAELMASLLIARVLAMGRSAGGALPDVVILLQANRLFRNRPVFRKDLRLLTAFVTAPVGRILSSDTRFGLDDRFQDTSSTMILSGDAWDSARHGLRLPTGMFALLDSVRGSEDVFAPRRIEYKSAEVKQGRGVPASGTGLREEILETISAFGDTTRQSLVAYLSAGWGREQVEREIDRLLGEGVIESARSQRRGSSQVVLRPPKQGAGSSGRGS